MVACGVYGSKGILVRLHYRVINEYRNVVYLFSIYLMRLILVMNDCTINT